LESDSGLAIVVRRFRYILAGGNRWLVKWLVANLYHEGVIATAIAPLEGGQRWEIS